MPVGTFTAVLHKERDLYVAECPEVGTVSQGKSVERPWLTSRKRPNCIWRSFLRKTRAARS